MKLIETTATIVGETLITKMAMSNVAKIEVHRVLEWNKMAPGNVYSMVLANGERFQIDESTAKILYQYFKDNGAP